MEDNKCLTCNKLSKVFNTKDKEYGIVDLINKGWDAYDVMKEMKEKDSLDFYMSDTPFEKWIEEIEEEKRYDYNIYMQCKECKRVYHLGICIRGTPRFEIFDNPPDKEEFKEKCKTLKRAYYL